MCNAKWLAWPTRVEHNVVNVFLGRSIICIRFNENTVGRKQGAYEKFVVPYIDFHFYS